MKTIDDIAAELAGYDPQALNVSTVNTFLSQLVAPVTDVEEVGIFEALGRVLAQDITSPISVPPHDNSAMDGYAFQGAQLCATEPLVLQVVGTALAGKAWQGAVTAGDCVKIMTGAIMPEGLDTVVPQEFVTDSLTDLGKGCITVPAGLLRAGDNRRKRGEDLMEGQSALQKGELLTPAALGLVASLGLEKITVLRKLRVAYFSTGNELLSLGETPREGAVFDSNRYTVFGLLSRLGCEVLDLGVVADEPDALEAAFVSAAERSDVIITSGGVSVGEADFTKAIMNKLGDVAFWKIAMRPGRPMAAGQIFREKLATSPFVSTQADYAMDSQLRSTGKSILLGLPGNPVAVMVTFLAFVRPALRQMMGATARPLPLLKARSTEAIRKKPGRTEYQRGWVSTDAQGALSVKTTGSQGSGVLSSMVQANGLLVLHHEQGNVAVGDEVDVMMFDGAI